MKGLLVLVTENQADKKQAEELAQILLSLFGQNCTLKNIERYTKFDDSYKLTFEFIIADDKNSNIIGIEVTAKICSPWAVYYDEDQQQVELIFNNTSQTKYYHLSHEVIRWGNWFLVE